MRRAGWPDYSGIFIVRLSRSQAADRQRCCADNAERTKAAAVHEREISGKDLKGASKQMPGQNRYELRAR